jgi:hypothetical protein
VLRQIFWPKREEVTGDGIKVHNEELHDLYSPNIRVIKSRKTKWTGHVAHMGKKGLWWEDLGMYMRMILNGS